MRTRAAAALQKVLTFQDVRTRVEDVAPSTVAPLMSLLKEGGSSKAGDHRAEVAAVGVSTEATSREGGLRQLQPRRERGRTHPKDRGRRQLKAQSHGGWVGEGDDGAGASKTEFQHGNKVISKYCI